LLFLFFETQAQQKKEEPVNNYSKITAFDTNYIYKYTSALTVGPCLSYRNFNILLFPQTPVDSGFAENLKWRSPSDRFWGLDFNYDKFGFTMSFASVEPKAEQDKKGKSSSSSFAFSYGGNRAFLEFSTMSFKGFYEKNTALMDTTLDVYYQSPELSSFLLNLKAWYFTNHHKFAFKSCYGGLYRQLRSQASWAFSSNLHFNSIITDSSMIPDSDKQFYDNALLVKQINSAGLSLMGGGAWNIVFKKVYFINLAWVLGPDFQALSMLVNDSIKTRAYVSYAQDFRFATGFNFNRWYLTFAVKHETNLFKNEFLETRIRLNSFSLNLGWRLPVKTPKLYKKFQNTWLYALF